MEFKINDLQGIIGAQNISRKIPKIATSYYLTVKLDAALLMYFCLFLVGSLSIKECDIFLFFCEFLERVRVFPNT